MSNDAEINVNKVKQKTLYKRCAYCGIHETSYHNRITNLTTITSNNNTDTTRSTSEAFEVCSACRDVHYCNRQCQKLHWKIHKVTCKQQSNNSSS